MILWLYISFGAVLGALSRYFIVTFLDRSFESSFPWSTLFVNILGSLLLGVLIGGLEFKGSLPTEMKAFLIVGVLGSFTTFSAFSLDSVSLIQKGEWLSLLFYVLVSVCLSIGALALGLQGVKLALSH